MDKKRFYNNSQRTQSYNKFGVIWAIIWAIIWANEILRARLLRRKVL
jgi:hypothetical protein